ncbi:MAG: ATP synthase F1 subunit delta [Chitinophagaceae bacterium]|jgi:F-type H+-transporting ATPase subunit delta|nr:ATP synthase F1 subunit delta [Chitinophagaceae bacterium]
MQNSRLSGVYAKSLIDLAVEKDQLEEVFADMQYLQAVCNASPEFTRVLESPIINADKKQKIVAAVTKKNVGKISTAFITLLIKKGREGYLPQIASAFLAQYNTLKGIHVVQLTTAKEASETLKKSIIAKLNSEAGFVNVQLETIINPDIIGGFILEYDNNLLDASVLRDLRDIKKQLYQETLYLR